MQTREGVEYQEGMTLYDVLSPELDEEPWLYRLWEYKETRLNEHGRVTYKAQNGNLATTGPPNLFFGTRKAAVEDVVKRIQHLRILLNEELAKWVAEASTFTEGS